MENDVKLNSSADSLGEDNADILAAKRKRAAESASAAKTAPAAVSAGQLRAQMSTARPAGQPKPAVPSGAKSTPSAAASSRPTVPAAKRPASGGTAASPRSAAAAQTQKTVKPAAPASAAAKTASDAQKRPAPSAAFGQPVNRQAQTVSARPKPTESAAAKPAADPAGRRTEAPRKTAASQNAKTAAVPTVRPTPKSAADPAPSPRGNTGIHSLIPHQQASLTKQKSEKDAAETRVTPMPKDATRVSTVSPALPKKKTPKQEREEEDESEGSNAIISVIKAITYIVAVVVVSVFLAVFIILVGNDIYAFVKDESVIEVTVPEYATLNDISELLYENGLIEYPTVFKIFTNLKMTEKEKTEGIQFVAGTYSLTPMMNYEELIAAFKPKKPSGTSRITIPEGYTTDQIIDLFVSKGIGTREGYVDVINNYDFDYWFIDELEANGWKDGRYYRLDGYLFPDTYEFYNASTEEVVIGKLLRRFNEVFVDSYTQKAKELGYTVDELLTIASMIEKEGGTQSDFFNISSVFNNRLNNPTNYPYLESDATIVYAIEHETGEHVNPTKEHTAYESPYNTYTNTGLPPGPIANPSASAIRAALYPADTKYYYFYSVSSTVTLYASTYQEHLENIASGTADTEPQDGQ